MGMAVDAAMSALIAELGDGVVCVKREQGWYFYAERHNGRREPLAGPMSYKAARRYAECLSDS